MSADIGILYWHRIAKERTENIILCVGGIILNFKPCSKLHAYLYNTLCLCMISVEACNKMSPTFHLTGNQTIAPSTGNEVNHVLTAAIFNIYIPMYVTLVPTIFNIYIPMYVTLVPTSLLHD